MPAVIASGDDDVLWRTFDDELDIEDSDGHDGLGFPDCDHSWVTDTWFVPGPPLATEVACLCLACAYARHPLCVQMKQSSLDRNILAYYKNSIPIFLSTILSPSIYCTDFNLQLSQDSNPPPFTLRLPIHP